MGGLLFIERWNRTGQAGGSGGASAYKADGSEGGEVVLTVDYLDEDVAWGSATMLPSQPRMSMTVTPTTFPFGAPTWRFSCAERPGVE